MRDAIVLSGWNWETFNVPERVALGFVGLGSKVLYCENPVSRFRANGRNLEEIESRLYRLQPQFLGHRLNRIALGFPQLQARMVANQILKSAVSLGLEKPLVVYPHGEFFIPLCRELKRRGLPLVHLCMDYPEPGQEVHIEMSSLTLAIPKSVFHELRATYGLKIALIPQVTRMSCSRNPCGKNKPDAEFLAIQRPRLCYLGPVTNRLNLGVLEGLLKTRPDWHLVHFGEAKCLPLPNVHAIAWRSPEHLQNLLADSDVGFMPYDCFSEKNFHCVPLKLFDYFSAGLPVVSTSIVNLREFSDAIYFGDDVDQLAHAIQSALDEPVDSPRRGKRIRIAQEHSIESLSSALADCLRALA
ncbi:MAG TPA: glycosyltransferase [Candidatus Acidoferrales bacterium]|nr:glycosyltransferase [Candidatus Acidoferrales bacterium]